MVKFWCLVDLVGLGPGPDHKTLVLLVLDLNLVVPVPDLGDLALDHKNPVLLVVPYHSPVLALGQVVLDLNPALDLRDLVAVDPVVLGRRDLALLLEGLDPGRKDLVLNLGMILGDLVVLGPKGQVLEGRVPDLKDPV